MTVISVAHLLLDVWVLRFLLLVNHSFYQNYGLLLECIALLYNMSFISERLMRRTRWEG